MLLTIKDTDYRIKFGVGFVRALDEKYCAQGKSGMKFGLGIETQVPKLLTGDPVALAEFLYTGTCTEEKRPKLSDIDEYIDNMDMKQVEDLFAKVIDELKKSNATMKKVGELEEALKKESEKQKKQENLQKSTKK